MLDERGNHPIVGAQSSPPVSSTRPVSQSTNLQTGWHNVVFRQAAVCMLRRDSKTKRHGPASEAPAHFLLLEVTVEGKCRWKLTQEAERKYLRDPSLISVSYRLLW